MTIQTLSSSVSSAIHGGAAKVGQWLGLIERVEESSWFGRNLCAISEMVSSTDGLHTLTKMALATAQTVAPWHFLSGVGSNLLPIHCYFKAVDIIPDLNYWLGGCANCPKKAHDLLTIAANSFFTVSDFGCTISFATFLGLINSSRMAATIGGAVVFGVQPFALASSVALSSFILTTACAGFALKSIHDFQTVLTNHKSLEAYMALASSVAEVGVRVLLLAACAFVATTWGVVSVGVLSFIAASSAGYCIYQRCLEVCTPTPTVPLFTGAR